LSEENDLLNKMEQGQDSVSPDQEVKASDEATSDKPTDENGDKPDFLREADDSPHDEFDWEAGNDLTLPYTKDEIAQYTVEYDKTFNTIEDNTIIHGVVVSLNDNDVVLNVGFKSDGLVSRSEFRDTPDLDAGDSVEVYVITKEDKDGQLVLSRKNAKLMRAWETIVDAHKNDKILKGTIVSKTKGGLIADVFGLETFLPGSQIDVRPILDYDAYVGKTMEFKVVKINEAIKNAVISHKALIESDLEEQRQLIIGQLEKGQVLEGIIKNITDFGAFIDLGGVDGLLYITDISWGRVNHPSEVLENGQKLNVVVLDFDDNKKRISLGLKQLQPHPWDVLGGEIAVGSTVKGKIVNIEDYGAFLEITPGVEGLIHISEVSWSNQPINSREFFRMQELYEAKVVTLDREDRKMSLSIKQLSDDPWKEVGGKFPNNSRHTGTVRNITPYGVFVELEEGIGGMVHISDLSWTKRFNHPSEFTKVNTQLEVVVLDTDMEGRKLSLGHKQIEEDPWDTFETVFPVGSTQQGTVIRADDRGATIALPYGVEAYAPVKHLKKEDGETVKMDENVEFEVIEFSREDKRIVVSHTKTFKKEMVIEKTEKPAKTEKKKPASGGSDKKKSGQRSRDYSTRNRGGSGDRSTFADLDVLSQLKAKMDGGSATPPADDKKAPKVEAPKTEAPKKEEVKEAPKAEAPKAEAPKEEAPKVEEAKEAPKADAPKKEEAPKKEAPKAEAPKEEAPKVEKAKAADLKTETKTTTTRRVVSGGYDLTKIEGIGPAIEKALNAGGIVTYNKLASTDVEDVKKILADAGLSQHNPGTWGKQAELARDNKWDELKKWQDELDGGK